MDFQFFPARASSIAGEIDRIYFTLIGLSLFFAVTVAVLIIFFAIRYRRGSQVNRDNAISGSTRLETIWIGSLLVLSLGVFGWGARTYFRIYNVPRDGLDVYVVGKQWMWKIQHPTGQREVNQLHVPVGQTVRLTLISQDVIHSFYVPAFRIKRDVLPGLYTTAWFEATEAGEFHLFCTEYCGTEHSNMIGRIVVMQPRQYQEWLRLHPQPGADDAEVIPEHRVPAGTEPQTMAEAGAELFQNLGCITCHRMDGTGPGPSLVGVYESTVELANGQTVVADIQYIRDSILDPNEQIVAGYPPIMPTYEGQINEEELLRLVEYIIALDDPISLQSDGRSTGDDQPLGTSGQ